MLIFSTYRIHLLVYRSTTYNRDKIAPQQRSINAKNVPLLFDRYCPHLFLSGESRELTPADIVETICAALGQGAQKWEIEVRIQYLRPVYAWYSSR